MPDYFSLAELRLLPSMSAAVTYPDERCEAAAAFIVASIEGGVGAAFVLREQADVLDGTDDVSLPLLSAYPAAVSEVKVNGAVVDVAAVQLAHGAVLRWASEGRTWPGGRHNIEVTYTAGFSAVPPADVKEAALLGTREHLLATSSNTEIAQRQQGLVKAAKDRDPESTGYVDVDAVIRRYQARVEGLGFA